ncbi:hypothetical protein GCM10023184_38810 [Flaviaesturariibacter amylovorans]|uniref:Copper oxidase n=2 Tax=Flaviaesturariibacter amylovorans TaxID=1084520 RepID=A0ABP8HLK3_9BACT
MGPVVEYHLYVKDTTVNYTGRKRKALAINGSIPAPTLRFTEGDSAVIYVHNLLPEEVSIHWHGILLPNEEDGVPLLNTTPIRRGETYIFRFRIIQSGTYWYHSHTEFQEQVGLYGSMVLQPAVPNTSRPKAEEVLQISDWRDERPGSIMRSLKRRQEWYAIKKKGVQSWGEAIVKGHFGDKVQMEWTRMPGADVSDVYYPVQLMHGKPVQTFKKYRKGDSVVLRVINGSAATYYWLQYSGGKMTVIAADGIDVRPVDVDKLLIATAETYDVIIRIPDNGQYEFRATAQDITTQASAFFGSGPQVKAKDIPKLDYMVLMNEMNRMTWMMKGMGMKMKMGLYMKMPEMDMSSMGGMSGMGSMPGMNGMNHAGTTGHDTSMSTSMPERHSIDTTGRRPDSVRQPGVMDHSNMPGHTPTTTTPTPVAKPKAATTGTAPKSATPARKPPVKKTPVRKAPVKKAPVRKAPPKRPAPKKDPMQGMDHSKMPGMKMKMAPDFSRQRGPMEPGLNTYLLVSGTLHGKPIVDTPPKKPQPAADHSGHPGMAMPGKRQDTIPPKAQPMMDHSEHAGMPMPSGRNDTTNPSQTAPGSMPTESTPMGSMPGHAGMSGMGATGDTSRSFMLQHMMTDMPLTGFDFPPGNGNDVVLSYDMLRSDSVTTLPANRPWREIELTLSGNMQRYIWSINGKTLAEQDFKVMIRRGENVRVVFTNATMMEHPIHLHGHFFRVINRQGGYSPMKHTFNIKAMDVQVIEFAATEEKDWFLHCHTLYHMISGMATIFSYEGTESAVQKAFTHDFQMFKRMHGNRYYPWGDLSVHSQGIFGSFFLSGPRYQLNTEFRYDYKKGYEVEPRLQRFLDRRQYFSAFIGADLERETADQGKALPQERSTQAGTVGLIYTLPFFIDVEGRVDTRGRFRLEFRREDLPLTTRTRLDFRWNTDKEFGIGAQYIVTKYLAISTNYDNEYGWGAGLTFIY